jgi:transcriptional regulator with XRE-family HTH domain
MEKNQKWPTPAPVRRALQRLGDDIVTWRKLQRLTAAQVADRAGINVKTLRALEHGEGSVSLENALKVARALGILDSIATSIDPYATDVGRLRTDEQLPTRVRPSLSRRG